MLKVAALYKFAELDNFKQLKQPLLKLANSLTIKGTFLLAAEGINGTIAGTESSINKIIEYLRNIPQLNNLSYKESFCEEQPFLRMKVKLKREIVTLGQDGVKPEKETGTYVDAAEWNKILEDPEIAVIDTRNKYETDIGTFKGCMIPNTENFRDFPEYIKQQKLDPEKPVAMCCTGGIRCEKASAYMLQQGFKKVYQLDGGILKYIETTKQEDSLWQGECFVFDNRVAVDNKLNPGTYSQCFGCRQPLSTEDLNSPEYKVGVHCPHCYNKMSNEHYSRAESRQKQMEIAKKRHTKHIGVTREQA